MTLGIWRWCNETYAMQRWGCTTVITWYVDQSQISNFYIKTCMLKTTIIVTIWRQILHCADLLELHILDHSCGVHVYIFIHNSWLIAKFPQLKMIKLSLLVLMRCPLREQLRVWTGYQENQYKSSPTPWFPLKGKGLEIECIVDCQWLVQSCLFKKVSKNLKGGLLSWWRSGENCMPVMRFYNSHLSPMLFHPKDNKWYSL